MSTSEHEPNNESTAQDLFLRYVKEVRSGGKPAFEALCEEYPDQASYLRDLHSVYELGTALASSQSFHESVRDRFGDIDEVTLSVDESSSDEVSQSSSEHDGVLNRTFETSRYSLQGEIARGGMGIVFRVKDRDLSRSIAMKVMYHAALDSPGQSDSLALARFLEEAQVMAQLDHPGIVPVHEVGLDSQGQIYFTMKLVKGRNFNEVCTLARSNSDGWNIPRALAVLVRVCQAVAFAHSKGVIHRDLKPSNIMLGRFGESYVMDWGLAKVKGRRDLHDIRLQAGDEATYTTIQSYRKPNDSDQELALVTLDGSVLGTPAYMPPEQAAGRIDEVDERSDIYSLGAVLYKLLTGSAPYLKEGARLSPHTILGLVVQGPPTDVEKLNPKVTTEVAAICRKSMQRDPASRYQSCEDLAEDLQAYLDRRVVRAYRTGAIAEFRKWVVRNRAVAASLSAAIVLAICGIVAVMSILANGKRATEIALFDSYTNTGLKAARDGDFATGLLYFAHATQLATQDQLRQSSNRHRLNSWEATVLHPLAVFSHSNASLAKIDFSPRGNYLLARSESDEFQMWDIASETQLDLPCLERPAKRALIDSTERLLALRRSDGVEVCEFPNGKRVARFQHEVAISAIAFSPDGRYLAVASDRLQLWDTSTKTLLPADISHASPVRHIVFAANGNRLVTACEDLTASVYSLSDDGREFMREYGPVEHVVKIDVLRLSESAGASPPLLLDDDQTLVTVTDRSHASWWDIQNQHERLTIPLGQDFRTIASSADRSLLMVCDSSRSRLWDVHARRHYDISELNDANTVALSPDGTSMVTGHEKIARFWQVAENPARAWSGELKVRGSAEIPHQSDIVSLIYHPSGRYWASAQVDGLVKLWSIPRNHRLSRRLRANRVVSLAAISEDGRFAVPIQKGLVGVDQFKVHDLESGKALTPPRRTAGTIMTAVVASDIVATASIPGRATTERLTGFDYAGHSGSIQLWKWRGDDSSMQVSTPSIPCGLGLTPNGDRLIALCAAGELLFYDTTDLTTRSSISLEINGDPLNAELLLSRNGRSVFLLLDAFVYGFDVDTGQRLFEPIQHPSGCRFMRLSADDQLLITATRTSVDAWSATTGKHVGSQCVQSAQINDVDVSRDGTLVATCCDDNSVNIWRLQDGRRLAKQPSDGRPTRVRFSPTDDLLATVCDGTLTLRESQTGAVITCPLDEGTKNARIRFDRSGRRLIAYHDVFLRCDMIPTVPLRVADADRLMRLGTITSGNRLVAPGTIEAISNVEWLETWNAYKADYPSKTGIDLEDIRQWHLEQAATWERDANFRLAQWHLRRAHQGSLFPDSVPRFERYLRRWHLAKSPTTWKNILEHPDLDPDQLEQIGRDVLQQRVVQSDNPLFPFVRFYDFPEDTTDMITYVARRIVCDRPRKIRILAGVDDSIRVWVNQQPCLSHLGQQSAIADWIEGSAELKAGENTLLVEVGNSFQLWAFYLRLEDESGRPLRLTDDDRLVPLTTDRKPVEPIAQEM